MRIHTPLSLVVGQPPHGKCLSLCLHGETGAVSLDDLSLDVGNQKLYNTLHKLLGSPAYEETKVEVLPLGCLSMAYPTLSIRDNDAVYLLSKSICMRNIKAVVAVDARKNVLQGLRVIYTKRVFFRDFTASGLSRYVTTDTAGTCTDPHTSNVISSSFMLCKLSELKNKPWVSSPQLENKACILWHCDVAFRHSGSIRAPK